MELESIIILAGLIFMAAILYSSVGHAGASGYLAAMALFGMVPMEMKPAALILNILVASIALTKYLKDGFNKIDTDNNNLIDFEEFMAWWGEQN